MTRNYIFVAETIYGIGGSQRYICDKSRWLAEQGWDVHFVYSSLGDEILDFSGVSTYHFPPLMCRPAYVPKGAVDRLIGRLETSLAKGDRIVVESSSYDYAFWGELIAERIGAKHLIFDLDEVPPKLSEDEVGFFRFKLERGELACITTSCLGRVFPDMTEEELRHYVLVAYMGDAVDDVPFETGTLPEADFRVGLVSRLDKGFVPDAFGEAARFCRENPRLQVNLVVVGDTDNEALRRILLSTLDGIDNLAVTWLGFMAPIPRGLVESFDVAVAKSGCAWACARVGVPTAVYSMDTDEAMGILGVDFDHSPSAADGAPVPLSEIIRSVLINGRCEGIDIASSLPPRRIDYDRHFEFLGKSSASFKYWDVKGTKTTALRRATSVITLLCGKYPVGMVSNMKRVLRFGK